MTSNDCIYKKSDIYIYINVGCRNKRMCIIIEKFRWNGVCLSIQSRSLFLYQKHLVNKALKLHTAFV